MGEGGAGTGVWEDEGGGAEGEGVETDICAV